MNLFQKQKNRGFTIIEALVAIFILSISVASMLGITASTASSARYANNEVTANYLLQEAIDSVRNSRDTMVFQNGSSWNTFLNRYGYASNSKCFGVSGCVLAIADFDPAGTNNNDVISCNPSCPALNYDSTAGTTLFYKYTGGGVLSKFTRKVNMTLITPDEIKVTATLDWLNGSVAKTQTLEVYLLNWQK